jgi:hypothetical protein
MKPNRIADLGKTKKGRRKHPCIFFLQYIEDSFIPSQLSIFQRRQYLETLTITLPKKNSLPKRISEVSNRLREWLKELEIVYNNEKDKIQLSGCVLKKNHYHYHYSIIKREPLSAFKAKGHILEDET